MLLKEIEAALMFAAKKDIREYLTGVHFLPDRIQASDGAALIEILTTVNGAPSEGVILDGKTLAAAVKLIAKSFPRMKGETPLELKNVNGSWAVGVGSMGISIPSMGYRYPEFERVIPKKDLRYPDNVGKFSYCNPRYLLTVMEAQQKLDLIGKGMVIAPTEFGPLGQYVWGLKGITMMVMPIRD